MICETPEAAATEYLAALRNSEWQRAAELVDPEFIMRFVQGVLFPYPSQYEELHRADPPSAIPHIFSGDETADQLASLTPHDLFARCLHAFSTQRTSRSGLGDAQLRTAAEIVGTLPDGGLSHVIYYAAWTGMTPKPYVLTVRRSEAGWSVLPTIDPLRPSPETAFEDPFRAFW